MDDEKSAVQRMRELREKNESLYREMAKYDRNVAHPRTYDALKNDS